MTAFSVCVAFSLTAAHQAFGSVNFVLNDNVSVWGYDLGSGTEPGVSTNWGPPPSGPSTTLDVHGTPEFDFSAGTVTLNDAQNTLEQIQINYTNPEDNNSWLWRTLKPGDLFLDFHNDGTWDAVGRTPFYAQQDYYGNGTLFSPNNWDLYELDQPVEYYEDRPENNDVFELASEAGRADSGSPGWPGVYVRGYHPWAMDPGYLTEHGTVVGDIAFDGWDDLSSNSTGGGSSTWTFTDGGYQLSFDGELGIGWGVNCANEVGHGSVPVKLSQIPEPGSLVVWCLIGLAFVGGTHVMRRRVVGAEKTR